MQRAMFVIASAVKHSYRSLTAKKQSYRGLIAKKPSYRGLTAVSRNLITSFLAMTLFASHTYACTDFRLIAKDGTILITRSMEFGFDLKSNVRSAVRGQTMTTSLANNKPGMSWKNKYGYLYLDGFNKDLAVDGLNEVGLSFEALYLPGEAQYQAMPNGNENQILPYYLIGNWILGNFKTIDEVRSAVSKIYVVNDPLQGTPLGDAILPLHFSVYDATGKGIVLEYVEGKLKIYDNIGIMTNSPTYDWHVTNLRNYLNLSPFNPQPITAGGITYSATGQGAGMVGLPGDYSPPSRFAKIAFLQKVSYPANDAMGVLNLGQHIINNVDIPEGVARSVANGKESSDITQWVVFKDITHHILYYRTYNDMTLRQISFDKVDFSESAVPLVMPLVDTPLVMDVTDKLRSTKQPPVTTPTSPTQPTVDQTNELPGM